MTLFKRSTNSEDSDFIYRLKTILNSQLQETEKAGSDFDLKKLYEKIGESIMPLQIYSFFSVIDAKRESLSIKAFCIEEEVRAANKENISSFIDRYLNLEFLDKYKVVLANKKPLVCPSRLLELASKIPELKPIESVFGNFPSIICPMVIKGEVIGFVEYLAPALNENIIEILENFTNNLVRTVANLILFEEIKKSEERYHNLWNYAPVSQFNLDTRGIILDVNQTGARMLGYKTKEIIGSSIFDYVLPSQTDLIRTRLKEIISNDDGKHQQPIIFKKKKGSAIYVSLKDTLVYDQHGKIIGVRLTMLDVTEGELAKKALEGSEEHNRWLLEKMQEGTILVDKNGIIKKTNQTFLNITGFSWNALKDNHINKIAHKDDETFCQNISNQLTDIPTDTIGEFKGVDVNGEILYFSYTLLPIVKNDKKLGLQILLKDITEKRNLENQISKSKKHYEQVIDSIHDGLFVVDKNFNIISFNRKFADRVNVPMHKIKYHAFQQSLKKYDQIKLKSDFCNHCTKTCCIAWVFANGKETSEELIRADHKGIKRYYKLSFYPSKDESGETFQVVVIIRDKTAERTAEENLKSLSQINQRILDTAPISIVMINRKGKIITANNFSKSLMEKPNHPLINSSLLQSGGIATNTELIRLYERLLKNGEPFYYSNLAYAIGEIDEERYLNIIAVPLFNQHKEIEGALSMAIDNTEAVKAKQTLVSLNRNLERKVAERTWELDNINKKLNKVLELKSKFLADTSHELRTPLTVIQGNLDLAIKEAENSGCESPELYELIGQEVKRMIGIITDLTILTNVENGAEQIIYERVDVGYLIKAVVQSLKIFADQKRIALIYKKNIKKVSIMGDGPKLEKLLLNIVRNALKYTNDKGKVKISVDSDDKAVKIKISDSGIGIPEADLPYIFERFYRVDKSRSRAEGGTGLGLSIAKWIAEAHGGHIHVDSIPGKGSTFTIFLPFDNRQVKKENRLFDLTTF